MSDRQCSSCGGICGRGGCERENVKPEQEPVCFKCGHAWHPDECVNTAPPARKPLSYMEACTFIALNIEGGAESLEMQSQLVDLIRAVERAHGIGEV